ncbi:MAG: N4-gp56 family major capsid protein [Candidatus Cloacimonadaceae bacterium]
MGMVYGNGTNSSIGTQFNTYEYKRKAIIETAKTEYFAQLGDSETLSKHYGQKLKKYHYLPLLDDRNINDQGLDAAGLSTANEVTITIVPAEGMNIYVVGNGADAAAALADAQAKAMVIFTNDFGVDTSDVLYDTYAEAVAAYFNGASSTVSNKGTATAGTAVAGSGNLYGSSKNPGYITGKLPTLTESGGRVNRVGFKRLEIEGEITNFGFFYEWSKDSMDFDTDMDLYTHINRESVRGAREITEDIIQMDLLSAAGVIRYTGDAVSMATTGYNSTAALNSVVTYDDLVKLGVTLDDNRCSKDTKAITGSKDTDVLNIPAARYMFVGSELIPTIMRMTDYHNVKAFIPIEKYGQTNVSGKYINALHGEIGSVAGFRIVVVPEMMGYIGSGETVGADLTYLNDGTNYNVYPMLVVGSGSFAHIRFQVSGGSSDKFQIIVRKPGTFANPDDPYEKIGYSSIQFWQGTLILRPEWIAKILTLAKG